MKILYVVNNPDFFLSHRLPLALAARDQGFEVHVATPAGPGVGRIRECGFAFHEVGMSRSKGRPWQEVATFLSLVRLYWRLKPRIVHHVTIKPVLYGSLAARATRTASVVNAVSGLGYVFISQGWKSRLVRACVTLAYRLAFHHRRQRIIFQNPDDRRAFVDSGLVSAPDTVLIKGSGVDLREFRVVPEPPGAPLVVLASRMLKDKGVVEFAEAAGRLKAAGTTARFLLVGDPDPGNPASLTREWLEARHAEGAVEWRGRREDMAEVLSSAHIVCLPSYREGLPKVLIEAAACGRAIVTTDVPGCREIVRDGVNGLLVPARDSRALERALSALIADADLRRRLGEEGRRIVEAEFSLDRVVSDTMGIYHGLAR